MSACQECGGSCIDPHDGGDSEAFWESVIDAAEGCRYHGEGCVAVNVVEDGPHYRLVYDCGATSPYFTKTWD